MENYIEKIRLNISKGWRGLFFSFVIIWITIYGILWQIFEPLAIPEKLFNSDTLLADRIVIQVCLPPLLAFVITLFLYFKLKKSLEKISLKSGDTNLKSCWIQKEGQSQIEEFRDGFIGRIVKISAQGRNALEYNVSLKAQKSKRIEYIVKPQKDFVLYVNLKLKSRNNQVKDTKWIAIVLSSVGPKPHGDGDREWSFPASPHYLQSDWMRCSADFGEIVKKTHGLNGWSFSELIGIRIRNNAEISQIRLY